MMKRKTLILLLLVCTLFSTQHAIAQSPPMHGEEGMAVLKSLKAVNGSRQTIQSTFNLTRHTEPIRNNDKRSGQFYFSEPNLLCFVYDDPQGDVLLLNKKHYYFVFQGERTRHKLKNNLEAQHLQTLMARCLRGDVLDLGYGPLHPMVQEFPTGYKVKLTSMAYEKEHANDHGHDHGHEHAHEHEQATATEATPSDVEPSEASKEKYLSIILFYDKDDLSLKVMRLNENNGNYAIYEFSHSVFNQEIKAKVFKTRTYPKKKD